MKYFIAARSFAAPIISDTSYKHVIADNPEQALLQFAADYKHPYGLFAAICHASADDFHEGKPHLMRWLSNKAAERAGDPKDGRLEP